MSETTIAVIGGGFSGTLLSLHLLRRCPWTTHVILIECGGQFGLGQAYATGNASHLLNVPAGRMSAFHDQPNSFLDWLRTRPAAARDGVEPVPQAFAPRRLYGAYVRDLLKQEARRERHRLRLVRGEVTGIDRTGPTLRLLLNRGREVAANLAVLAIGSFPPPPRRWRMPPSTTPLSTSQTRGRPTRWSALTQQIQCCWSARG